MNDETDPEFKDLLDALNNANHHDRQIIEKKIQQWVAIQEIEKCRLQYENGDKGALLHAIRFVAANKIPFPDWVASEYIQSYDQVLNLRVGSWDEAFGKAIPKGRHLNGLKRKRELRPQIYLRIKEILNSEPNTPIDEALFERVGEEFSIKKTLTSELYYDMANYGKKFREKNNFDGNT